MDWRFWRLRQRDAELDEEIAHDLRLDAAERVQSGLSLQDAERASRRDFGNVLLIKETTREAWAWRSLEILAQDLRYALRTLARSPVFSVASILMLGLGVGVNTAVFSIFDQVAFRPLPVKDGRRIVGIYETFHGRFDRKMHGNIHMLSYPEFLNYQAHNEVFEEMAACADVRRLTLAGAQPEPVSGLFVTLDYFRVFDARPAVGRMFLREEMSSAQPVAVLSHRYWQRRFGGDAQIVGKTISLNRQMFTIVGVVAPGFVGTTVNPPDLWLPLSMQPRIMADLPPGEPQDFLAAENLGWLDSVGKLRPGLTVSQARANLGLLASQMDRLSPGRVTEVSIVPSTFLTNPDARPVILIAGTLVLVAVGLVLFVACANVANLLLVRATARQREIAVRLSIGASRARVVRQLLTESSLLAVLGSGLGLLLAQRVLHAGRAAFDVQSVDLRPDANVLAYTIGLAVAASVMFGLVPALQATRPNLSRALKDEGSMAGPRLHKSLVRSRLIATQVAICSVLLVGAALLVRGLMNLNTLDPGYPVKNLFLTTLDLELEHYDESRAPSFYRDLLTRIDAQPGTHSGLTALAPFRGVRIVTAAAVDGSPTETPVREVNSNLVSASYFDVLGIALSQGRVFTETEEARGDPVAVINQAMARTYWPGERAIGKRFLYGAPGRMQAAEVIGVVRDVRSIDIATPDGPLFYLPAGSRAGLTVVTRFVGAGSIAPTIAQIVRRLDPAVLASVRTVEDNLAQETSPMRIGAGAALLLGGLALLLAAVGIYGVTAYVVSQGTHDIGIRLALGASRQSILRGALAVAMRPVGLGILIGLTLSAVISSLSSKLLLGVHPLDPVAFLAVATFLTVVAVVASYVPAVRAARVDPLVALRHE
jgi:putative ABC transport system permease protein